MRATDTLTAADPPWSSSCRENSFCLPTNKIWNKCQPEIHLQYLRRLVTRWYHTCTHTQTHLFFSPCPWPRRWTPPCPRPCPPHWLPHSKSPWCRPQPPSSAGLPQRWHRGCGTPGDTVSWLMFRWQSWSSQRKIYQLDHSFSVSLQLVRTQHLTRGHGWFLLLAPLCNISKLNNKTWQ